ncbi:MAG: nucleotide exchange factor GrpE [Sphingobacteriales bacterium]|nr:MAG: nucleotide exchange factor GrpE [Sphingobacteriales bacterium]
MFGKKKVNIEDDMQNENQNAEPTNEQNEQAENETFDNETAEGEEVAENSENPDNAVKELQDKYMRLFADFENFRRRTTLEKRDLILSGNKDLLMNILPVFDDFERALSSMEKATDINAVKEGVMLIFNKFRNVLQQSGLKDIDSKGKDFDPELHDALTKIPAPSADLKGKVVDEIQKGYTLHDKIVRHAKVVVGE